MASALISAGGSILGGIAGGKGADEAAKAQAKAQEAQLQLAQNEFNTISGDAQPNITAGTTAVANIMNLLGLGTGGTDGQSAALGQLQQSPLYQSEFNSGLQALDQNEAATGGLRGGNGALAQSTFGSNLLNSLYQQQIGNLGTVANIGTSSLGTLAGAGSNFVNASGTANTALGGAEGTAAAAPYNAFQQILSGLGNSGVFSGSGSIAPQSYAPVSVMSGYTPPLF